MDSIQLQRGQRGRVLYGGGEVPMRVREDRLRDVRRGRWSPPDLAARNPVVVEAVRERFGDHPAWREVYRATGLLSAALALDQRTAPRVGVTVAARALAQLCDVELAGWHQHLHVAATVDPVLSLVCDALVGQRSDGRARPQSEREAVTGALSLVLHMAGAQEEIDQLQRLVSVSASWPTR